MGHGNKWRLMEMYQRGEEVMWLLRLGKERFGFKVGGVVLVMRCLVMLLSLIRGKEVGRQRGMERRGGVIRP